MFQQCACVERLLPVLVTHMGVSLYFLQTLTEAPSAHMLFVCMCAHLLAVAWTGKGRHRKLTACSAFHSSVKR